MIDIKSVVEDFALDNELSVIVDTAQGLNVERDRDVNDAYKTDNDCIFLNVIMSGSMQSKLYNTALETDHSFEIGFLRRVLKQESEGSAYYDAISDLIEYAQALTYILHDRFEVIGASYSSGVDELDNNNAIVRLNISIKETQNICS